ncbi:MAG: hypothetical protein M1818_008043 [Claussenomyces sp. TS43310]|nr:MAG: hypothetical protein M1818_008043 [Claussenomyces sp. TS43310]
MQSLIKTVIGCFIGKADDDFDERTSSSSMKENATDQAVVTNVLNALRAAEKNGRELEQDLDDIVGECGWEEIAAGLWSGLEALLREGAPMGQAMKDALDRAMDAAVGFAREHPVFCALLALGILVVLVPWAVEALGFGELGPIEGSFAAWWQARYAGYVPKGALFSFLQRLGMIWKCKSVL